MEDGQIQNLGRTFFCHGSMTVFSKCFFWTSADTRHTHTLLKRMRVLHDTEHTLLDLEANFARDNNPDDVRASGLLAAQQSR